MNTYRRETSPARILIIPLIISLSICLTLSSGCESKQQSSGKHSFNDSYANSDKGEKMMMIELTSPRPLSEVALILEKRFDRIVTYEDAPYRHPQDMVQDQGGRIIPRGGQIIVQYHIGDSLCDVINKAQKAYTSFAYPGVFAVAKYADSYHIIPHGFRNAEGTIEERVPLLETIISLPSRKRSGLQLVKDIALAITEARGEFVALGVVPTNALTQHAIAASDLNGKARDLLIDLFREMGLRLSWQLLNVPNKAEFYLNIHQL